MNKNWKEKTLAEVCIVERGSSPRPIKKYLTTGENGVNWIKIGDAKGITKYITKTKEKITKEGAKKSRYVKKGDFILSNSMSFGKPYVMKTDGYIHDGWFVLRLKDFIDTNYFYYLLSSPLIQSQFNRLASGAIVKNISSDLVKKARLPHPPLPEQKRIVKILDKAFAAIDKAKENAEKNLQNSKELFDSYLQGVFAEPGEDWEIWSLGDSKLMKIIDGDRGKNYPKKKDFLPESYCLFMNTKNVRPNGFDFTNNMFITKEKDSALGKGNIQRNDVVMTTRGTIGNLGLYNHEVPYENIRINSGMLIFRPNIDEITPEYLFEILRSGVMKLQIAMHVSGAAQPQLPIKTLVNFKIPVPKSIKFQNIMVNKIQSLYSETEMLHRTYNKKILNLEELKKSILQKAFEGEL